METQSQESSWKQRNPKYPKSLNKIRSKSLKTKEIAESSQIKNETLKPKQDKYQTHNNVKKYDS